MTHLATAQIMLVDEKRRDAVLNRASDGIVLAFCKSMTSPVALLPDDDPISLSRGASSVFSAIYSTCIQQVSDDAFSPCARIIAV
jgi:hypothetical protein